MDTLDLDYIEEVLRADFEESFDDLARLKVERGEQ